MVCKNCFAENNEGAAFCTNCGAPLEAQPQAPVAEPVVPQYDPAAQQYAPPVQQYAPPAQQYAPYGQPVYQQAPKAHQPGKGLAIAGMVCGICALALFCLSYIGLICGILGIIFGAIAKYKGFKGGMATAGIVCGSIGVGLFLLLLLIGLSALSSLGLYL